MPFYFLLSALWVAVDQVVKYLVRTYIPLVRLGTLPPGDGPDLCPEHRGGLLPAQ